MGEGRRSVLVVEDDGEMRNLLRDGLWSEGYRLQEVGDGDAAVQSVLQDEPDLILTEIRLPAGGVGHVSRLRALAPSCPIVVMTAFGDEKIKGDVLRAGATAYFNKPVHLAELMLCVNQLLGAERSVAK